MEDEDTRYAYAAFRKGALARLSLEPDLSPSDFREAFWDRIALMFDVGWTVEGETPEGRLPMGFIFGIWPSKDQDGEPMVKMLWLGDMIWFPWASSRNAIEGAAKFIVDMKRDAVVLEFARMEDKGFFEHLCKYGVMRRVGTFYGLYDGPAAVFQSRV